MALRSRVGRWNGQPGATMALNWEFTERGTAVEERHVVTCFLELNGRIMILRRSQRVGTYRGKWAGVSGYIERGMSVLEQAWAEIEEEAGLGREDAELVQEGQPLEVADAELDRKWIVHLFRFKVLKPEKAVIGWEHTEAKWIAPEEIAKHETVPGLLEAWQRVSG